MSDEQKNWFGMEIHPSDCLISYHDRKTGSVRFKGLIESVRADWDKIAPNRERAAVLDRLLARQEVITEWDIADPAR